jgi:hypothetical protein
MYHQRQRGNLENSKRDAIYSMLLILNKINSWFPFRSHGDQSQWDNTFKVLKKKPQKLPPKKSVPGKLLSKSKQKIRRPHI